jgi:hypothetical protein
MVGRVENPYHPLQYLPEGGTIHFPIPPRAVCVQKPHVLQFTSETIPSVCSLKLHGIIYTKPRHPKRPSPRNMCVAVPPVVVPFTTTSIWVGRSSYIQYYHHCAETISFLIPIIYDIRVTRVAAVVVCWYTCIFLYPGSYMIPFPYRAGPISIMPARPCCGNRRDSTMRPQLSDCDDDSSQIWYNQYDKSSDMYYDDSGAYIYIYIYIYIYANPKRANVLPGVSTVIGTI